MQRKKFPNVDNFPYLCSINVEIMKNSITIKLNPEDIAKARKAATRDALIEAGKYNIHKNRVFASKKSYTRKDKHKTSFV